MDTKPDEKTWVVYLALCRDLSLYCGITTDVTKRFQEHNAGTGAKYTRSRRPVHLMYTEVHLTRSDALKRECAIKKLSCTQKWNLIKPTQSHPLITTSIDTDIPIYVPPTEPK